MTEKLNGINEVLNSLQLNVKTPKGKKNNFGNYKYRTAEDILAAVKIELKDEKYPANCIILTNVRMFELANKLFVQVIASLQIGKEVITAEGIAEHAISKKGMDEAQLTGATITYARKYALQNLFGIDESEDDLDSQDNEKNKEDKLINIEQGIEIEKLCKMKGVNIHNICKFYGISVIVNLPSNKFEHAISQLQKKPNVVIETKNEVKNA